LDPLGLVPVERDQSDSDGAGAPVGQQTRGAAYDHAKHAIERVDIRYDKWDNERGRSLPRTGGPTKDEMRHGCRAAIRA
jgi:hypothetical protein